jgi:hypothetical protein
MFSWALALWSWVTALRVMRKGCVTEDYLDPMCVTLQSIRWGSGWKRFLVFAELTKSKKKVSWIALFVYFQRLGEWYLDPSRGPALTGADAIRLLAADGPRQVVNALTLWKLFNTKLLSGGNAKLSAFDRFFDNLKTLGASNREQTIILSSMAFTLFIWAVFMIFLLLAFILYIFFLWHHIQNNTLTGFCRKKVETRLARIVKAKTDKIWAKQQAKYEKANGNFKASQTSLPSTLPPGPGDFKRQPTLPSIIGSPPKASEPAFSRSESVATLPVYSSQQTTPWDQRPALGRQPTLPDLMSGPTRPQPSRSGTMYSESSYNSDAPLLSQAGGMGYSDPARPAPLNPRPPPLNRSMTGGSERSFSPMSAQGRGGPPHTGQPGGARYPPPARTNTAFSTQSRASPMSAGPQKYYDGPTSARSERPFMSPGTPYDQRTPAYNGPSYEMTPVEPYQQQPRGYGNERGDYFSQNPNGGRNSPAPLPASLQVPRRDMSAPVPPRGGPPNGQLPWPPARSATAPVPDYARGPTERSHTAGPRGF